MFTSFSRTLLVAGLLLSSHVHATSGQEVARQMQANYDATPKRCEGNAVPAHACSGVMIRATKPSPSYHSWHHSPNTKAKGGLSFSYLRADIPITQLAADARSGFTLHPQAQRPDGSLSYEVLCAWPTDGDSWERNGNGCGDNAQTTQVEQACHQQGILNAEQWVDNFRSTGDYKRQCAFDTRLSRIPGRADDFYQSLRAKQLLGSELPYPWNEVIVRAWDEASSQHLPIQSFFHIEGMYGALEQAQADQRDWHRTYGDAIPIIRIQLPRNGQDTARFSYHEEDQTLAQR